MSNTEFMEVRNYAYYKILSRLNVISNEVLIETAKTQKQLA